MPDHTPAPWFDDGYRIYAPTESEDKRNGRVIVEYKHVEDFNQADAPLIKTAPELLESLRQCRREYASFGQLSQETQMQADAAIAKAEGRS